jgi:hypothetical protein
VPGPSIPEALLESVRALLRGAGDASSLDLAVQAAVGLDPEERAWTLVALARRLRRDGHVDFARRAVEAAVALDAGPEPTRAAQACAVVLHADEGDLETAVELGEALLAEGHDEYLLKTMARVYWSLWRQTKDETWHDRWWRIHVRLHEASAA